MADLTVVIEEVSLVVVIPEGIQGPQGPAGPQGAAGIGVPNISHTYNSDQAAAAGGIVVGGAYWAADNHMTAPAGCLVVRTA